MRLGAMTMHRRFPSPWHVHELEQACVVEDANGQAAAYTQDETEPLGERDAL
jgi:hypothetical protein